LPKGKAEKINTLIHIHISLRDDEQGGMWGDLELAANLGPLGRAEVLAGTSLSSDGREVDAAGLIVGVELRRDRAGSSQGRK